MVYSPKENMELNIWHVSVLVKQEQIKTQYAWSIWLIYSWAGEWKSNFNRRELSRVSNQLNHVAQLLLNKIPNTLTQHAATHFWIRLDNIKIKLYGYNIKLWALTASDCWDYETRNARGAMVEMSKVWRRQSPAALQQSVTVCGWHRVQACGCADHTS